MAQRYEIDRRGILATLILLAVAVKVAGCSDDEGSGPSADAGPCDGLEATSTLEANHTHLLCIPRTDLEEPPEDGAEYRTDTTAEVRPPHTHTVTLTLAQLETLAENGTVEVTTSTDRGHDHTFTLSQVSE